jgi:hypothetical protein
MIQLMASSKKYELLTLIKFVYSEGRGVVGDPIRQVVEYVDPVNGEVIFTVNNQDEDKD